MSHDWILDVIADLRTYAVHNALPALARQLDDATLVAAVELAARDGESADAANSNEKAPGQLHRALAMRGGG